MLKTIETWKDIEISEVEGLYQVSNQGRIRSAKDRTGSKAGRILKLKEYKGYRSIGLYNRTFRKSHSIARLVALAFVPNHDNKPQVNHINGIKTDNRPENLEWVTASENSLHAYKTGLIDMRKLSKSRKGNQNARKTKRRV